MKKTLSLIFISLFLVSCGGGEEEVTQEDKKADFFIDVINLGDFDGDNSISKVGKIKSSGDISLTSQANGRVTSVDVKAGDNVLKGQVLARLSDSIGNYEINLQRAGISVERTQINYDSTKLSLDKQIFDSELNLEKLERNLVTLRADAEKNITLSQDNLDNAEYENLDSTAALQLQQLDNNIEKAKLDYEIKLDADEQQIESHKASIKKEFTTIRTVVQDVIDLGDELLGVTDANDNNDFDSFLGARDKSQKNIAKIELLDLMAIADSQEYTDTISLISQDITESDISKISDITFDVYEGMISVLIELETTLNNSIESVGTLGETEISAFITQINGLQSQVQGSYAGFIATRSQIDTFLTTYKNNQASLLKAIELQEKDREITFKNLTSGELSAEIGFERTVLSLEDSIKDLESQVNSARNNLENAIKNKEVTLRSLQNAISDAQVGYASALKEYNKLVITSPINGSVGSVDIDVGQEIFSNTPVFSLVSDGIPEVEISLSFSEKKSINLGDLVSIKIQSGEVISGKVYSISDVADANLNYVSTVVFDNEISDIGSLATVSIPVGEQKMLLPLNVISTVGDDIGLIKALSGSTIADVRIRMGEVYGDNVEIVSCAKNCNELKVILSDTSNFDENKFIIKEK